MRFGKWLKDSEKIKARFEECLKSKDALGEVVKLIRELRKEYNPRLRKKKSVIKWIKKIEQFEKIKPRTEWNQEEFDKFMRRTNIEVSQLLQEIPILKQSNKVKEYYLRVIFYSEMINSTGLLTELVLLRQHTSISSLNQFKLTLSASFIIDFKEDHPRDF